MVKLRFSTEIWAPDSALIRWRTQCAWSHVEFEREDGSTLGARFSPFSKKDDGFIERPVSANSKQARVVHYTFPGIELAHEWGMNNLLGHPYDWRGILGIALARDVSANGSVFCSYAIFLCALYGALRKLVNDQTICDYKFTPRDLLLSNDLTPTQ